MKNFLTLMESQKEKLNKRSIDKKELLNQMIDKRKNPANRSIKNFLT